MKISLSVALKKIRNLREAGNIAQSRKILKAILTTQPEQPECNYELGSLELISGHPKDALQCFKIALSANPKEELYWDAYVKTLLELNKIEDAISALRRAQSFNLPKKLYETLERKIVQARSRKSKNAKKLSLKDKRRKSTAGRDPDANSLNMLISLYSSGRYQSLLDQLPMTFQKFPKSATLYNLRGATHDALESFDMALADYDRAIKLRPDYADAYNNKGNFFKDRGNFEEAIRCFRKALAISPNYPQAHNNLGITYKKRHKSEEDLDSAIKCYKSALKLNPNFSDAHNNMGSVLAEKQKFEEAIECYGVAIKLNPSAFKVISNIGSAQLEQGRFESAINTFEECIGKMPNNVDAYNGLASALRQQGDLDSAKTHLLEASRIKPDCADTWTNLGLIHQKNGQLEKARDYYQKTLEVTDFCSGIKSQKRIIAFHSLGRSGSFFFHSLIDGHPRISTLPGAYFKGWFEEGLWNSIHTDPHLPNWREKIAENIVSQFKPLFDSGCKYNVRGSPLGNSNWLARDAGFTEMGNGRDELFKLDPTEFKNAFIKLLESHEQMDPVTCFELIHQAFDLSYRENVSANDLNEKIIFYHIHNPEPYLQARVLNAFPNCLSLYVVRHPVQCLESWMAGDLQDFNIAMWFKMTKKFDAMLTGMASPYNFLAKGVKLEDIKSDPKKMMQIVAAWMGIEDDLSLYLSEFCNLKYWGPPSAVTGAISGFDKSAISTPLGHFFGQDDVKIFETLFWPLSKLFGYTELSENDFVEQLKAIEPMIEKPLKFEEHLYEKLNDRSIPLVEIPAYKYFHSELKIAWAILMRDRTYKGLLQPLALA